MKKHWLYIVILIVITIQHSFAQKTCIKSNYEINLIVRGNPDLIKGYLLGLNNSSIQVKPFNNQQRILEYKIDNIQYIRVYKRKELSNEILIGAVSGIVLGGIVGNLSKTKKTAYSNHPVIDPIKQRVDIGNTIGVFTLAGIVLGAILGSKKQNIPFNNVANNPTSYEKFIDKYSIPYFTIPSSNNY